MRFILFVNPTYAETDEDVLQAIQTWEAASHEAFTDYLVSEHGRSGRMREFDIQTGRGA
ncbi:hypothetical protein J31TS4_11290 [Paenibacillus sp. J31TS4]|nr:hypothetical protein J31TS4_11290 [Paenibacillus sp. J31TS4]